MADLTSTGSTMAPAIEMRPAKLAPFAFVFMRPASMFRSVDFPDPEGPRMQAISPGSTLPETLSSITLSFTENRKFVHSIELLLEDSEICLMSGVVCRDSASRCGVNCRESDSTSGSSCGCSNGASLLGSDMLFAVN